MKMPGIKLLKEFMILELQYDFMGYFILKDKDLSYHHLIIPRCFCGEAGLKDGYYYWNGVILNRETSHQYLHTIEEFDKDRFLAITSEMLDEKLKGYLDMENIVAIDDILTSFENEYADKTRHNGHPIIREEYKKRILRK